MLQAKAAPENVYMFSWDTCSHSKDWEIILNIDTIIASILKKHNFSCHKQAWYSFEVLTKLVLFIIGATMSHTKSQIHQNFSLLLCFSNMFPVGRGESWCKSMTYGSSVIAINSWIQHRDSHLHVHPLVRRFLAIYTLYPCAFSKHLKAKLMNFLQHANVWRLFCRFDVFM